ncbi:acyltransferase domain-containing protein, partial [Alkalihalobacillus hemicellulosilyticus]|uniref:acyltransferase domain-containing protein n=1 Tax=Halalkalibacter hemicellulosilyticus TaxID=127886 RepID=UPI000558EC11
MNMKNSDKSTRIVVNPSDNIMWMFTGQGSLNSSKNNELFNRNKVFKHALTKYTDILKKSLNVPILEMLLNESAGINQQTQIEQPATVALQLAQISMWNELGVKPKVVLGHSIGEFAAAVAAGIMKPEDALKLAIARGKLMSEAPPGSMAAVFSPAENLKTLPRNVVVAAVNGPALTVLAGPQETLSHFVNNNYKDQHMMLNVSYAFHSPSMNSAATEFGKHISGVSLLKPKDIQFISSMTGEIETERLLTPEYWKDQIINPVNFLQAIKTSFSLSPRATLSIELGSDSALINMARRIIPDMDVHWVSSTSEFEIDETKVNLNIQKDSSENAPLFRSVR